MQFSKEMLTLRLSSFVKTVQMFHLRRPRIVWNNPPMCIIPSSVSGFGNKKTAEPTRTSNKNLGSILGMRYWWWWIDMQRSVMHMYNNTSLRKLLLGGYVSPSPSSHFVLLYKMCRVLFKHEEGIFFMKFSYCPMHHNMGNVGLVFTLPDQVCGVLSPAPQP